MDGATVVSVKVVTAPTDVSGAPFRKISYPVTPMSSVEAVQDRSTRPEEIATAPRPVGSLGLVTSLEAAVVTTSCGLFVASREEKSTPSVEVPASTKL